GGSDPLLETFARVAARRAGDLAVVSPDRRATFGEIDALADAIASRIDAEPATLVGLAAPNGPAFLAGLVGLRRAGATALLLDGQAPVEDRRRALRVLGAAAVLECSAVWPSSSGDLH